MPDSTTTSLEIQTLFEKNKLDDLKEFMKRRKCLNSTNMVLIYLFHIIQSAGILTTTIAAGYDMKSLVWIGVGLNILASLINVFEKRNNSISKALLKDIQAIKDGTFLDEGTVVEIQAPKESGSKESLLSSAERSG
jgi:hypothetical protein